MVDPFSIKECMFLVREFFFLFMLFFILYLEVNKDFTDCKQCFLPLL